jgi:putative transposase
MLTFAKCPLNIFGMLRARQLPLPLGRVSPRRRKRPGRKPNGPRAGVSHLRRPAHCHRHPLHVTVRVREGLPSLRSESMFRRVLAQLRAAKAQFIRILHFSIQSNHIHLLVEAKDRGRLTQGMKGFAVRVAKGLNDLLEAHGSVWADRYHARALETPRQVRNALVYVIRNRAKHSGGVLIDRCSSAPYFDGWDDELGCPPPRGSPDDWPVAPSRTWLMNVGWKPLGRLRACDLPAGCRQRPGPAGRTGNHASGLPTF